MKEIIKFVTSRILLQELSSSEVNDSNTTSSSSVDVGQLLTEIGTNALLFLLIFGMAGTVDIRNLKRQLHNRYAILTGIAMQFLIMPLLGFLSVISLKNQGLTTSMGITLLIVTASPGGSYSNWWCSLFNADLALSVAMTALSTILSIGLLPANLMLYAHAAYGFDSSSSSGNNVLQSVDFVALFISLAIVIGAIVSGLYASYRTDSAKFRRLSNSIGSIAGIALIVLSAVFSTNSSGEGAKPWEQHWSFYVGVALPCIAGLILANVISRCAKLEKPEVVTLSVECCYQNVGIAASAVLSMFDKKEDVARAMAVPLFYGIVEAVVLGIYCLMAWKFGWTKAPSDEKICIVLAKTYEVEDDDDDDDDECAHGGDQCKDEEVAGTAAGAANATSSSQWWRKRRDSGGREDASRTASVAPTASTNQSSVKDEFVVSPLRMGDSSSSRTRERTDSVGNLSYDSDHSGISFDTSGKSKGTIGSGKPLNHSIAFKRAVVSDIVGGTTSIKDTGSPSVPRAKSHEFKPRYDLSGRGYIIYSKHPKSRITQHHGDEDEASDGDLEC